MSNHDELFDGDDWTPDENAQLSALSAEKRPPEELKRRTMEAMRRRGLLGPHRVATPRRVVALLAAASVIFIAGALVGYVAARRAAPRDNQARVSSKQELKERLIAAMDHFNEDPVVHTWTHKLDKAA